MSNEKKNYTAKDFSFPYKSNGDVNLNYLRENRKQNCQIHSETLTHMHTHTHTVWHEPATENRKDDKKKIFKISFK